jgi:hypothetical protein
MVNIASILKNIEEQSRDLAEKLFTQFAREALADVKDFLRKSNAALGRWVQELARGEINQEEFKSLVEGQLEVTEMRALKQAGLAQVRIDLFVNGVLDIVFNTALAAIP